MIGPNGRANDRPIDRNDRAANTGATPHASECLTTATHLQSWMRKPVRPLRIDRLAACPPQHAYLGADEATTPILAIVPPLSIEGTAQMNSTTPDSGARASKTVRPYRSVT